MSRFGGQGRLDTRIREYQGGGWGMIPVSVSIRTVGGGYDTRIREYQGGGRWAGGMIPTSVSNRAVGGGYDTRIHENQGGEQGLRYPYR